MLRRLLTAVLAMLAALAPLGAEAGTPMLVRDVRVEGLHSIGEDEILYLLNIKSGGVLTGDELSAGIQRVYLKGIFNDISVEAPDDAGGPLVVRVDERDVVTDINIKGLKSISKGYIEKSMKIKEGDFADPAALEEERARLSEAVMRKGFPDARVTMVRRDGKGPDSFSLTVQVEEGVPWVIRSISIMGAPAEDILDRLHLKPGGIYDQVRLQEDLDDIRDDYKDDGYIKPVVGPYVYIDGDLAIAVRPGKRLDIKVKGNYLFSSNEIRGMLPFDESGDVDNDAVAEAVSRIKEMYFDNGYSATQVAPVIKEKKDDVEIVFYVYEGKGMVVGNITFDGNSIPAKKLKEIIPLKEGDPFSPQALDLALDALKEFYAALGYKDMSVEDPRVKILDNMVDIDLTLREGEKVTVSAVKVEGLDLVPVVRVPEAVAIKEGDPYNEVDIADTRRALLDLCRSYGLMQCEVDVDRAFYGNTAEVTYTVREGPLFFFGKTVIAGNRRTRRKVFLRSIDFPEGTPVNQVTIDKARQELNSLGLFSDVDVRTLPPSEGGSVDIQVNVKEAKAGFVEVSGGYGEYERWRGALTVGYRNLGGMGREASFRTEQSMLWNRYILTYHEPWFMGMRLSSKSYLMAERFEKRNVDTDEMLYRLNRYVVSTSLSRKLVPTVTARLTYDFSLTDTYDILPSVILSREDTGTLAVSSLTPGFFVDTRDKPYDPARGTFSGISAMFATKYLMSQSDFIKITANTAWYFKPFSRMVLALGGRGGFTVMMGDTGDLPLTERFYLGGRDTVRGFEQDMLGPKSATGDPIGGNVFLLTNLEIRFRLYKSWIFTPFFDYGGLWLSPRDINEAGMRPTAGAGMEYMTPVGPLRIDNGYKLDRMAGESPSAWHFSIGHAF